MKYAVLSALGSASLALGHGLVTQLEIGGTLYDNYAPYTDPYRSPKPERIGWTTPGDGPVDDVTTAAITCNTGSTAGTLSATATAGSEVKFFWTVWPESHRGPTMTYLAKCPGTDCVTADATALDWFKINDAGLNANGTWASDTLIANNNTWTVTIPSDIVSGPYLLRHELLALHSASSANGAQFYPMCANLKITGSGSAVPTDTVKLPGAYSPTDPGILINIYYPVPTKYTIPGPAVYVAGGSSTVTSDAASSSTLAGVPNTSPPPSTGTGPTTFPTIIPSVVPPYVNTTVTHALTRTRSPASQTTQPARSFAFVGAAPGGSTPTTTPTTTLTTTVAPEATYTKTVTITVPGEPAKCTPVGRHRRGTYF